ncbi:hypothetical protein GCM10007377_16110 [Galliscardovia ingluviei]|uniref:Uncharacterized protein n=1 Tax=Galliscardovia ingluviei TaxID=1769422 RepID=A0A8J3AMH4_9BIFI|nr:hypothetical protein [Galliscardovia ingluviei]GGI15480.1 hypothetical protein GCM10007377_16110 [Galliscardovia ingluviei]
MAKKHNITEPVEVSARQRQSMLWQQVKPVLVFIIVVIALAGAFLGFSAWRATRAPQQQTTPSVARVQQTPAQSTPQHTAQPSTSVDDVTNLVKQLSRKETALITMPVSQTNSSITVSEFFATANSTDTLNELQTRLEDTLKDVAANPGERDTDYRQNMQRLQQAWSDFEHGVWETANANIQPLIKVKMQNRPQITCVEADKLLQNPPSSGESQEDFLNAYHWMDTLSRSYNACMAAHS